MAEPAGPFESEADAIAVASVRLSRRLGQLPHGFSVAWSSVIAPGVLTERIEVPIEQAGGAAVPAMVRRYRYVIRTEDLKLSEALMDALAKLIPAGMLFPVSQPAATAGAITSVVIEGLKLLKRARDKGATLDDQSYAVLTVLQTNGPMAFDRLLTLMRAYDPAWTDDRLRGVLQELKAYPSRNGTGVALVKPNADETEWRTTEF